MKVLHLSFCYHPDPVGGTEIYVEALANCQKELGMDPLIGAPAPEDATYTHSGLRVFRYRIARELPLRSLYGEGDATAAASFARLLQEQQPDLIHLHAFTSANSIRVVRAARHAGVPVVFTYHTATVSCVRSTLLLWGKQPCDGRLDLHRCTRCRLHSNGLSKTASWLAGSLPPALGTCLGAAGLAGGMWTALRASELIRIRHAAARALFAETNAVVAVCEWTRQLLIRNGVSKSYLIRNGVDGRKLIAAEQRQDRSRTPLRIAYLGRITAGKGLDVLLGAMRLVPELPLELDIFAVTQGSDGETLRQALSARCGQDRRIRFLPPIPSDQTVAKLREYDLLAFPSQAMEPGPLVILEALAAGAPVIGSDLGGIPEMIRHEGNGLLVEPASAAAWGTALRRLVDEPDLLPGLRRGIGPVRTMAEVAKDLEPVYEMVLENRS